MKTIVVDIGNTSTSFGIFTGKRVHSVNQLPTASSRMPAVVAALNTLTGNDLTPPQAAIIASVVPLYTARWKTALRRITGVVPVLVSHQLNLGITIDYPHPQNIGADRLANAVGAVHRYGSPVIVADFGTALTFDIVDDRPAYVGGVIAPGLPLMMKYLPEQTALLPHFEIKGNCGHIGRSTLGAMRIGARIGYQGMVREIYKHICQGLPHKQKVPLIATGGFARWIVKGGGLQAKVDQNLTLYGLGRVLEMNQ